MDTLQDGHTEHRIVSSEENHWRQRLVLRGYTSQLIAGTARQPSVIHAARCTCASDAPAVRERSAPLRLGISRATKPVPTVPCVKQTPLCSNFMSVASDIPSPYCSSKCFVSLRLERRPAVNSHAGSRGLCCLCA